MTTEKLVEKVKYSKTLKEDCAKWRKFIKKHGLSVADVYLAFNTKYPEYYTQNGFQSALNGGKFRFDGYQKARDFFLELEEKIKTN